MRAEWSDHCWTGGPPGDIFGGLSVNVVFFGSLTTVTLGSMSCMFQSNTEKNKW